MIRVRDGVGADDSIFLIGQFIKSFWQQDFYLDANEFVDIAFNAKEDNFL